MKRPMSVLHAFIDESGDLGLGEKSSTYFVVAALILAAPSMLDKIIKKMRRTTFYKELSSVQEIKATHSSTRLKNQMISAINQLQDVRLIFAGIDKKEYIMHHPTSSAWKIYSDAMKKLITNFDPRITWNIKVDRTFTRKQFEVILQQVRSSQLSMETTNIAQAYSFNWSGLQFADLYAWIFFRLLENGDRAYVNKITIPYSQIV